MATQWAFAEYRLSDLFAIVVGGNADVARRIYWEFNAIRVRLDLADDILNIRDTGANDESAH